MAAERMMTGPVPATLEPAGDEQGSRASRMASEPRLRADCHPAPEQIKGSDHFMNPAHDLVQFSAPNSQAVRLLSPP